MGMDVDGLQNDKGLYALIPIQEGQHHQQRLRHPLERVLRRARAEALRLHEPGLARRQVRRHLHRRAPCSRRPRARPALQRLLLRLRLWPGLLSHARRARLVQQGDWQAAAAARSRRSRLRADRAFWSPDGKYLVFSRAAAKDPYPPGSAMPTTPTIPTRRRSSTTSTGSRSTTARAATPERVVGASENGMSNNFPKVSPDGKWIVFVQMQERPADAARQQALHRALRGRQGAPAELQLCRVMNSWHSWSPNGHWLAFSSKEPVALHADLSSRTSTRTATTVRRS